MRYRVGLYGGSFDPLHIGHVDCILQAANQCDELYVVLSVGVKRDTIDPLVRFRWLYQLTSHLPHVHLLKLEDALEKKEEYTADVARADCQAVKAMVGKPIDAVFFGDDYGEDSFWRKGYPESKAVCIPRDEVNSSDIRRCPYAHWDWIPTMVRPYYVKKVLILGGESTGKSTLTIQLAHRFCTNYIDEAGRDISLRSGAVEGMLPEDFTEILLRQKLHEIEAVEHSNKVLFIDTDAMVTRFYLEHTAVGGEAHKALADAIDALNTYDLILFLDTDVPFVQDGTRDETMAADRAHYSDRLKAIVRERGRAFHVLGGDYQERYEKAVALVKELLEASR